MRSVAAGTFFVYSEQLPEEYINFINENLKS